MHIINLLAGLHQQDPSQSIGQFIEAVASLTPPIAKSTLVLHAVEPASVSNDKVTGPVGGTSYSVTSVTFSERLFSNIDLTQEKLDKQNQEKILVTKEKLEDN